VRVRMVILCQSQSERKSQTFRPAELYIPAGGIAGFRSAESTILQLTMSKSETMRGLERGLRVLEALEANPISSLHDLHHATGISKTSLLRILQTLAAFGLVSRRLGDGRYRTSTNLTRTPRRHARYERVAEAAAPVLDRLCQKISWPSDLMVPAGDHMLIAETSQTQTPFLIKAGGIGRSVNWLLSAVGRAYLAHCPDKEREGIIAKLGNSERPEDHLAHEPARLARILAETRHRGYGIRDPGFVGGFYGTAPQDDGLAAIALPLLDRGRVHGAINILWVKTAFSIEDFARRHLADLQNATREIVDSLHQTRGRQSRQ
jgi:IclR family transcriptional regulator, mhp operon transcriptional activator